MRGAALLAGKVHVAQQPIQQQELLGEWKDRTKELCSHTVHPLVSTDWL